jgi:hypothetical protein
MFELETIRAAVSVGAGVAELIGHIIAHVRGGAAVDVRPRLDEIERALPDIVHAVRHGTAAEAEAEPAELDPDDDPAKYPGAAAEIERELEAGEDAGGPDAEAQAQADDKAAEDAAADTAGDTTGAAQA